LILIIVYLFLRKPLANLLNAVEQLREAGNNVSTASSAIANSSQSLSSSATEAAASIETTSASAEEVSGMIEINSKNADQAKLLSQSAQDQADKGRAEVLRLISSMNEIASGSKKIEEIISVIDDIAFQTNLLALNASVEAARAGEQGKGFAVVAEAVRALAQRSAGSAKEINDLIKESVEKISKGCVVAEVSGKALEEIVQVVAKVNQLNTEVSSASKEQSSGVAAINQAIVDLDKVTQSNAAIAEESAAAAEELSNQSQKLHHLVESLDGFIQGKKAA
jgi:methyl-accepting chemotaxis protein